MWTARRRAGGSWPTSRCRPARIPLVIGPAAAKRGRVQANYQVFLGEVAIWSTARGDDAIAKDAARGRRPATQAG